MFLAISVESNSKSIELIVELSQSVTKLFQNDLVKHNVRLV